MIDVYKKEYLHVFSHMHIYIYIYIYVYMKYITCISYIYFSVSWIICNKTDLLKQEDLPEIQQNLKKEFGIKSDSIFFISAATGEGTSELLGKLETEILRNKSLEG